MPPGGSVIRLPSTRKNLTRWKLFAKRVGLEYLHHDSNTFSENIYENISGRFLAGISEFHSTLKTMKADRGESIRGKNTFEVK